MATEWRTVPIRDLCLGIFDGPHATPKKTSSGPVFLGISSLVRGRLDLGESAHLSESDFTKWTRRVTPRPGDVVFSYETRLGEAAIIPEGLRCCLGRRMALMRPDEAKVDSRFLLYAYLGPEFQATLCERTVHGSTVDRILLTEFPDFKVRVPDLDTQRAISRLLGALDDKIELNRRMNHTLESIARAIFKSWFVDFDPVRKKKEGSTGGLPPELSALFPGDLVASAAGPIPQGWQVQPLDEVANFLNGLALQKYPPSGSDDLPVIKGAELTRGVTAGTSRASGMVPPEYIVRDGDLLFSWSGSLHCVIWSGGEGALNQHLFKVTSAAYPKWFVYQGLHEHLEGFRRIAADKATTMGHIKRGHLSEAMTVIPTSRVLAAADAVLSPIHARQLATDIESHRLVEIRDALLPRLLSGTTVLS